MVQELLQEFYRNTKKRPERLIIYRDGVSEGQFDAVVREELPQVFFPFFSHRAFLACSFAMFSNCVRPKTWSDR